MSIATWEFESPPLHHILIFVAVIAQLVEHDLAKVGVASSSLVYRSFFGLEKQTIQMNLYIRYFDKETLVYSADEAVDFLCSIPEIGMNPQIEADVREYVNSDVYFPKRYKVRPRVYFIIIKTEAATMLDFKQKKALRTNTTQQGDRKIAVPPLVGKLTEERQGWYEGTLDFKRVVMVPSTGKHEYRDTRFVARCKAVSGMDCYNRIVDHLRERVDTRSQFPSAKGKNFKFRYLGMWK